MKGILETLWGLLVDDGSLAVGIVAALAITWIVAATLGDGGERIAGWLLLAMLAALMLVNLQLAGRKARRKVS